MDQETSAEFKGFWQPKIAPRKAEQSNRQKLPKPTKIKAGRTVK